MSKAKKVHQIFALLNANAPDGYASHGQLLADASCLVDLFDGVRLMSPTLTSVLVAAHSTNGLRMSQ